MYNNNINEIHKFPSFVFGEINSHQTWGVQMGTIRGYSVHKPRNISRDYPPTHCWLKCPFQGKQAAPPLQPLKRWKTQTLGALETTLDNIRNRDHSVHINIYLYNLIYNILYALYALWSKFHQVMTSHFKAFFAWKDFRHALCEVSWTQFQTSLCRVYTTMRYHVIMYHCITVRNTCLTVMAVMVGGHRKTLAQHGSAQLMTWWTRWDLSLQHPLSHRCRPWCPGDPNSIELLISSHSR